MDQLELHAYLSKRVTDLILEYFNYNLLESLGASGPVFHTELSQKNKVYKDSGYYYEEELEFIHFTTLKNLFSILNDRCFRFYNLHNSSDPNEYSNHAQQIFNDLEEIEFRKKFVYTFSFCPLSMLDNMDIWRKYGQNYKGVAVRFKIINDPSLWQCFHISEIKYEQNQKIFQFSQKKRELEKEYNIKIEVDLSRFIGFHKVIDWDTEKEIRMLTYFPFKRYQEYDKFSKVEYKIEESRHRFVEYINLPLWVDDTSLYVKSEEPYLDKRLKLEDSYFIEHPKIQISGVYWGKAIDLNYEELAKLSEKIVEIIQHNFGYRLNLSNSFQKIP